MTITLQAIKAEQTKIAEMISAFEAQSKATESIRFPEQLIELNPGEHYAGIVTAKDGTAPYHLILLPGDGAPMPWKKAQEWVIATGGELPNSREQALLYANLKEQFEEAWYWSSEPHATDSDYAWLQDFYYGNQYYDATDVTYRARAVRRLEIQ